MKAIIWHGTADMRCESAPDPQIEHPRDAMIKVTSCATCGSDLRPDLLRGANAGAALSALLFEQVETGEFDLPS